MQVDIDGLASISLPALPDLLNPAIPGVQMRVHLTYLTTDGSKRTLTRSITKVGAGTNTLFWTEDTNANSALDPGEDRNSNYALDGHGLPTLPTGFVYESARLEAKQRKYTWLATIRPQDDSNSFVNAVSATPTFDVTIVVYYGRGFSTEEEAIFGISPGPVILNAAPGTTKVTALVDTQQVIVDFPTDSQPALKRGGFLCDVQNGYWYQIQNYTEINPTSTTSTITLETIITKPFQLAMFPRGVVDVFPITPQSPESL